VYATLLSRVSLLRNVTNEIMKIMVISGVLTRNFETSTK
jgi:hypothetical protein